MSDHCVETSGDKECECKSQHEEPRLVVLTGGPGAGKTAVLELVKKSFCKHIRILPEAASILFLGGFTRGETLSTKQGIQRAIFHVQRQLEQIAIEDRKGAVILCDRGSLDGLAYWPGTEQSFFSELGTSLEKEYGRYSAVIHMRSPSAENGYNFENPARTESATEAAAIDEKIAKIWRKHPNYFEIQSETDFIKKAQNAVEKVKTNIPDCCQHHEISKERKVR